MSPQEQISQLTDQINFYTFKYYQENETLISDQEFDFNLKALEKLEAEYPDLKQEDSPTNRVGGTITKNFNTVEHKFPMLSLSNTYNEAELIEWDERIQKILNGSPYEYICELKFDGISLSMTYENGILKRAVTRGDGAKGDDITANVKTIKTLPLSNQSRFNFPIDFEIRGEGFMPNTSFERLNAERLENNESPLANPRNAASGAFKMQDSAEVAKRGLDAYIYQFLTENETFKTHEDSLIAMKKAGFNVSQTWKKVPDIQAVIDFIEEWKTKRHSLPCATDGIVIKINNYAQREDLGVTSKSPRWAISYKYKAESKSTLLRSVTFQVGRTGAVTPVGELEPIELAMTMVKRATLHNADELERLGLRIGDYVFVEKAGEIIPKITGVDNSRPTLMTKEIEFPRNCPACGTELTRKDGEAATVCPNEKGCLPQIKGKVEHFIQRKGMNIDSLGEGKLEILFENKIIDDAADLYFLKYEDLIGLEKTHLDELTGKERKVSFKEKTVQNILDGIEKSKAQPFSKVLYSMGIRFVGETTSEKLAAYFKNLEAIKAADFETLRTVPDVGEKVAQSLIAYFQDEDALHFIDKLQAAGLNFVEENSEKQAESDSLAGKLFLYTGSFLNFSRTELEDKIESNGGKLTSGVSKKLDFLIVGSEPGPSKINKAEQLGVKMISESEFQAML